MLARLLAGLLAGMLADVLAVTTFSANHTYNRYHFVSWLYIRVYIFIFFHLQKATEGFRH